MTPEFHILLLRGLGREHRHWHGFDSILADRLPVPGETHCLDLPGIGSARSERAPLSVAGIARTMRKRWLSKVGADDALCGVVGISLGGMVAMDWITRWPQDFGFAVLMNASTAHTAAPHHRLRLNAMGPLIRAAISRNPARSEEWILRATSAAAGERHDYIMRERIRIARERTIPLAATVRQFVAAAGFAGPSAIRVPTLVLAGLGDRLTSPSCSMALARRFGADLRLHPTAGHDLTVDAPEWAAGKIADWLENDLRLIHPEPMEQP